MKPRQRGVTIIGLLVLLVVMGAVICGGLYIKKKALAGIQRLEDQREAKLDEAAGDDPQVAKMVAKAPTNDLYFETPGEVWTELTNAPGWYRVDIPDEEYYAAVESSQTWAILESSDLIKWRDTGTRLDGTLWSVKQDLRNWATNEAPFSLWGGGGHSAGVTMNFFLPVDPSEVPVIPEDK